MDEEWRRIPGFGGFYNVSDFGRVCSTRHGCIKIKKLYKNKDGYLKVRIGYGELSKVESVHRLVASLFIGNTDNMEVNHIDGDKENNVVGNLEICTHKQNMEHAFNILHINHHGMKGKVGKSNHLSKPIFQMDINGAIIREFDSLTDAAHSLNLGAANISKAALGRAHTCGGFKWSYKL